MQKKGNIFVLVALMMFLLGLASSACAGAEKVVGIRKAELPIFSLGNADAEESTNIHTTNNFIKELTKNDEPCLEEAKKLKINETYGNIPLSFIQNDVQMNEKVAFYERGNGHSTFFTKRGVYLGLTNGQHQSLTDQEMKDSAQGDRQQTSAPEQPSLTTEFIRLTPLGANKDPEIFAEDMQKGKVNYFSGNDPEKWKTNIPTWQSVVYEDIYDGIDMKFYGNNRQMEYDIIVKPGASPSRVQLAYQGIEGLHVTDEGNLEIALKEGKIIHKKPYVYQEIEGKRVEREGSFKVQNTKPVSRNQKQVVYGFEVASYNKKYPLVIDPVLVYSTYLGGSGGDLANDIDIDSDGNVYITGTTYYTDFPMVSALYGKQQITICDAFVTKINATGTEIVYSTYLGGPGINEITQGIGIAADTEGNVYVTGYTSSYAFPTTVSAYDRSFNGSFEAFVTKINASGASLLYSTYLGGTSEDIGIAIDVDTEGNAYIAGYTYSSDFPTVSPLFGSNSGNRDVFITKINISGTSLLYSTYLGGNVQDTPGDIAIDTDGNLYITGWTGSSNFPLAVPFQNSFFGNTSVFITKINAAGTNLVFSTFLGGRAGWEEGRGIEVDSEGNVYVVGGTHSDNFPMVSAMDASANGYGDAFVVKLNPPGTSILFSTYLGGLGEDEGNSIALDADRNVYVTGKTASSNFPTLNPISTINSGGDDVFITKFDTDGNLLYSTYLGGSSNDDGRGIAVDTVGNAYITGVTQSSDFPTASPLYGSNSGGEDVFVAKIGPDNLRPIANAGPDQTIEQTDASGAQVTLDGTGSSDPDGDPLTYTWTGPFGNATGPTPTVTMPPGANTVYLVVNDGTVDSETDTVTITVQDTTVPVVSNTTANPNPVAVNTACAIIAQIDDTASNISYAEYSTDGGTRWYSMDAITAGTNSVNVSVTMSGFTEPGLLTVSVRGTDSENNTGEPESIYLPVYDPSAGHVTGGGWIWSPQGAYAANTTLEGKAHFGFVAKYKKGANTPDGNTEFQFKTANLNFHSNTYEWLVVAGYKAMFKGTGTINGEGSYKFMISAVDGSLKNNSAEDTFRIRIWGEDSAGEETTIYDNQMDADIDAEPTTTLGGGSIIIHKGK